MNVRIAAMVIMLLGVVAAIGAAPVSRTASNVLIAGAGQDVWFISELPADDRPARIHHVEDDVDPPGLRPVVTISQMPQSAAAFGRSLYYLLPPTNGADADVQWRGVRRIDAVAGGPGGRSLFTSPAVEPPLPGDLDVRAFGAGERGPLALSYDAASDAWALHEVRRGAWTEQTLGFNIVSDQPQIDVRGAAILILDDGAEPARLHRRLTPTDDWSMETIDWPAGARMIALGDHIVAVGVSEDGAATMSLVWGDATVERARFDDAAPPIAASGRTDAVAIFWEPPDQDADDFSLNRRVVTIDGVTTHSDTLRTVSPVTGRELLVLGLVMGSVFLTIIVFVFKPESVEAGVVDFPEGAVLAEPTRRMLAFLVDLLPAATLVGLLLDRGVGEVLDVFGVLQTTVEPWPLMLAAGAVIVHSAISEALWGRTFGKLLVGAWVIGRDGAKPGFARALARNVVKVLCPPLALFILLSPSTSPPGSFGTWVVVRARPEENDGGNA